MTARKEGSDVEEIILGNLDYKTRYNLTETRWKALECKVMNKMMHQQKVTSKMTVVKERNGDGRIKIRFKTKSMYCVSYKRIRSLRRERSESIKSF